MPKNIDELAWREHTTSRLASIETKLDGLIGRLEGDGQPGILVKLDTRVRGLEDAAARQRGFLAALTLVAAIVGGVVVRLFGYFVKK